MPSFSGIKNNDQFNIQHLLSFLKPFDFSFAVATEGGAKSRQSKTLVWHHRPKLNQR